MYLGNNSVCLPQLSHPAASYASQKYLAVQNQQVAAVEQNQNTGAKRMENVICDAAVLMHDDDKDERHPEDPTSRGPHPPTSH